MRMTMKRSRMTMIRISEREKASSLGWRWRFSVLSDGGFPSFSGRMFLLFSYFPFYFYFLSGHCEISKNFQIGQSEFF